ncbi:Uncharacterised protein [Actinomyces viscosus]|uniref:Uncharacterized protein n=1 Tax=Actinomyces viscosus TaxID=1656 RepID=A0A448PJK5_ACTVI|nr:Uncharacterised protein [Actinomyces viscosus]
MRAVASPTLRKVLIRVGDATSLTANELGQDSC